MQKARKTPKGSGPDWANQIIELRHNLRLNQAELGQRLHYSAMAVSRWERGEQEPTDRGYIELGNLAGDPNCWYFWGRGGLHSDSLLSVVPRLQQRLHKKRFAGLEIVTAGSGDLKHTAGKLQLIAIPVLKTVAAAHGEKGGGTSCLLSGPMEGMIAAPRTWCPNPTTTSCLRVRGNSMAPILEDGYIIAVDYSQNDHTLLNGKIVIAWNRDKGLTVSRFKRYDHTEVLEPENRGYESITVGAKHRWKIIAKVLWWIGKAA